MFDMCVFHVSLWSKCIPINLICITCSTFLFCSLIFKLLVCFRNLQKLLILVLAVVNIKLFCFFQFYKIFTVIWCSFSIGFKFFSLMYIMRSSANNMHLTCSSIFCFIWFNATRTKVRQITYPCWILFYWFF